MTTSRFYKLTYLINEKRVNTVINLYAISRIEHCEKEVKIIFQTHSAGLIINPRTVLELTSKTETHSAEIYAGIVNAMNPINAQKLA
jgi:hypothetical protein